jgi:HEPN domain-containing protein
MINSKLAKSYLTKAATRLKILPILMKDKAYSDVIRESQEIVELALKGILREIGVEPPKWHDVGPLIIEFKDKLPEQVSKNVEKLAAISKWLRKEREFAFYGEADFIPTEEYDLEDAERAVKDAKFVVGMTKLVVRSE